MGATLYDDAIVKIFQSLVNDPNLKILKPEETTRLFEEKLDEGHDKMPLPIIALSRRGYIVVDRTKQPKSYDGIKIRAYTKDDELVKDKVLHLTAIQIRLDYQLDIYTVNLEQCEDYSREFIFYLINNPTGQVDIPYNNYKGKHKFTMHIDESVEDNSDIKERLFPSQFTRYTIRFMIDDAYLWSIPTKKNVEISCAKVIVEDIQSQEEIEEIKIEPKS